MSLGAAIRPRSEIGNADVDCMYALYSAYYAESSRARFAADLEAKDYVIELREGGVLRGFSTLAIVEFRAAGAHRRAIYSGDTIIEHRYWGEQALASAFCRFAGSLHAADAATPLYWLLITKGHRTYRYLGAFARQYFPHPSRPTTPLARECIDTLARQRFGSAWRPDLGVVRFETPCGQLRAEWSAPRPTLAQRSDVAFFVARNPGYVAGDELVCLAELTPANLRSHARRAFLEGRDESPSSLSVDRRPRGSVSRLPALGAIPAAPAAAGDSLG